MRIWLGAGLLLDRSPEPCYWPGVLVQPNTFPATVVKYCLFHMGGWAWTRYSSILIALLKSSDVCAPNGSSHLVDCIINLIYTRGRTLVNNPVFIPECCAACELVTELVIMSRVFCLCCLMYPMCEQWRRKMVTKINQVIQAQTSRH